MNRDADPQAAAPATGQRAAARPVETQARDEPRQAVPANEAGEPALPPIESLDEHSDYRAFLSDEVSEDLRRTALRKLFSLPQFNVTDGLNDYDEDFASFKPLGDIVPHDMARGLARVAKQAGESEQHDAATTTAGEQAVQQPPEVAEADKPWTEDTGEYREAEGRDETTPKG